MDGGLDMVVLSAATDSSESQADMNGPTLWEILSFICWTGIGIILFLMGMLGITIYWATKEISAAAPILCIVAGIVTIIGMIFYITGRNHERG